MNKESARQQFFETIRNRECNVCHHPFSLRSVQVTKQVDDCGLVIYVSCVKCQAGAFSAIVTSLERPALSDLA